MKKLILRVACIALALPLCLLPAPEARGQTLINGIDKDYPPFAYIDEKGNVAGFDVESMNWIAARMGFTVEHRPFEWKTIVQMLVENKIQMVCSGMSITPERAEQVLFSEPYWTVRKVFMAKKGSGLNSDKVLHGKVRLGVQQGTNEDEMLQEMLTAEKADFSLVRYATPSDAILDLLAGRIAAAAMDSAPAANAVQAGRNVEEIGTFGDIDQFGVAVNKNHPELLRKINEGYRLLKADPFWEELKKKYDPH